ncbi:MAG: alpha/beta hydrolase [Spirochaetaceae bacterium]|nr:alpha/beta hydrolase [Spirochaetaceae bacterium]
MDAWHPRPDPTGAIRHEAVPFAALGRRDHRPVPLQADALCAAVRADLRRQGDEHRDVLFFIHGHRLWLPGLRLGLLRELHDRYVAGPRGPVGVIVFFSWPDRGWPWLEDDEAYASGDDFFARGSGLLAALRDAAGGRMHLLVQSFGHHLLAGMVARAVAEGHDRPPFRSCLLAGADVPQASIGSGGVILTSRGDAGRSYRFDQMHRLAERTVVYYDPRDRILPAARALMMNRYPRLGRLGCAGLQVPDHITCRDVSGAGDLPRWPLARHRSFITSRAVAAMMAAQIRC